jgi:hypothetical protein
VLEHVIGFTPKGSVCAEGFDPRSLRQLIITDSQIDSKSRVPKLIGLRLEPWPLLQIQPFHSAVRETAILRPALRLFSS